jgi:dTDP-4-dehydrorhamnose reductase
MGRVVPGDWMYEHARYCGVTAEAVANAVGDGCPPDLIGVNYYVTSDRWLDHRLDWYPAALHGGNGREAYVDVEAVRAAPHGISGQQSALVGAWERYGVPVALTETHLACTREHQLRWLHDAWHGALSARAQGVDVRAVTAWSAFGAQDWASLVTRLDGEYEAGLFDVRVSPPRATALATMVRALATEGTYDHPVLDSPGWWWRDERLLYRGNAEPCDAALSARRDAERTILILNADCRVGAEIVRACTARGLAYRSGPARRYESSSADGNGSALAWAVIDCTAFDGLLTAGHRDQELINAALDRLIDDHCPTVALDGLISPPIRRYDAADPVSIPCSPT